ncbi:hypothetical protein MGYG_05046 [Nannizzia gypsea CBS 118893]|uniref:Uncharacterized protein n=1 Tax=Arthroderma gypseum (strain ATCC MYA-4604 / CBS 118893) TaxID=535722 RepID=E4UY81_ARTGP|nr:hypothetical protein MGYG_05046 [Nannizzia gypsea CBS 118893]EFR02044.1 hypothetical protein MGYG_05046 [Nannizzia gypsea CBS 118893]
MKVFVCLSWLLLACLSLCLSSDSRDDDGLTVDWGSSSSSKGETQLVVSWKIDRDSQDVVDAQDVSLWLVSSSFESLLWREESPTSPSTSTSPTATSLTIALSSLLLRLHRPSRTFTLELRRHGSPSLFSASFSVTSTRVTVSPRSPSTATVEPAPGFEKDDNPNPTASVGLAFGVSCAGLAAAGIAAWICIWQLRMRKRKRMAGGARDSAGHSINGDEEDRTHGTGTEMEVIPETQEKGEKKKEKREESQGQGQLDNAMMARLGV